MNVILAIIGSILPSFFGKYVAVTSYNDKREEKEMENIKNMLNGI